MKQETTSPKRRFETVFCKEELPAETNKEYLTQLGWLYFGYLNEDKQWYDNNLDEYLFPDYWLKEVESLSPVTDGDAEKFLTDNSKFMYNPVDGERFITIGEAKEYASMKVAEETKELNHHIRERAAAIEKIFKLEKELEQLKSAKVEGVEIPNGGIWSIREFEISEKTQIDCAIFQYILDLNGTAFLFSSEYSDQNSTYVQLLKERLEIVVTNLNQQEMRDGLMPLINNKPDDKFEFATWVSESGWMRYSEPTVDLWGKYINDRGDWAAITTNQLYQKFLSRNEEPES